MRIKVLHLVEGAAWAALIAAIAAAITGIPVLGLDPATAALVTGILKAVESWLRAENHVESARNYKRMQEGLGAK